ncbi:MULTISPECIES: hypothetical protein, partial [unclassified Bradyrhizobium]|uniref:hypothetical protein n=1 Tax=unclassified Bradyrhizobium TaxID=2631580 RepID=UPI0028E2EE0E
MVRNAARLAVFQQSGNSRIPIMRKLPVVLVCRNHSACTVEAGQELSVHGKIWGHDESAVQERR